MTQAERFIQSHPLTTRKAQVCWEMADDVDVI